MSRAGVPREPLRMCVRVLRLWCLCIPVAVKVCQPEVTHTRPWAGWGLWTGFLWPTSVTVLLLVLTRINFQQLQTGIYYKLTQILVFSGKKNQKIYTEPEVSCQQLSGPGLLTFHSGFPSTLSSHLYFL